MASTSCSRPPSAPRQPPPPAQQSSDTKEGGSPHAAAPTSLQRRPQPRAPAPVAELRPPSMACPSRARSPSARRAAPPPPQQSSSSEEFGSDTEGKEGSPHAATQRLSGADEEVHVAVAAAKMYKSVEELGKKKGKRANAGGARDGKGKNAREKAVAQMPLQNSQSSAPAVVADGANAIHIPSSNTMLATQLVSGANEEAHGGSSEPVSKKTAAMSKTAEEVAKKKGKRANAEGAPAGKGKKAKAELRKVAPEASHKEKKAKGEPKKPESEATPSGKAKKPGGKPEKSGLDSTQPLSKSEKSARAPCAWSNKDSIKILEALAAHVQSEGRLPKTNFLLAAVHDSLDRKDCSYSDLYEKVRRLKERYEKTVSKGVLPSEKDELQMYHLSKAIWGDKAKGAIAASATQNVSTATKSNKGQDNKEKMDGSSRGGTSKDATHKEEAEIGARMLQGMRRSSDELQNLYPSLAWSVETMVLQHPCGETLKRGFEFIDDQKANSFESKIEKQRISEVKVQLRRADISKEVLKMLNASAD